VDCSATRELLSQYADDVLDPRTRKEVDEHLAGCTPCTVELEELRNYIKSLASLQKATAPPGFLDNLHARLEQPSRLRRVLVGLFLPWRIKLPLELTGVVAAALLVFIIHQGVHREQKPASTLAPLVTQAPPAPAPSAAPDYRAGGKETAGVARVQDRNEQEAKAKGAGYEANGEKVTAKSEPATEQDSARINEDLARARAGRAVVEPEALQLTLLLKPEPARQERQTVPRDGTAARDSMARADKPDGESATRQPAATPSAEQPAEDHLLRSKPPARPDRDGPAPGEPASPVTAIRVYLKEAQGTLLSVRYQEGTQSPESLLAEVPAHGYSRFVEKLRQLGELEGIPQTPPSGEGAAPVRLHIVFKSSH
jgi:hypothetical protein